MSRFGRKGSADADPAEWRFVGGGEFDVSGGTSDFARKFMYVTPASHYSPRKPSYCASAVETRFPSAEPARGGPTSCLYLGVGLGSLSAV